MEKDETTARQHTGDAHRHHMMRQRNGLGKPDDRHNAQISTMAVRPRKSSPMSRRLQALRYNWTALKVIIAGAIVLTGLFAAAHLIPGHIFPNIWSLSVPIGGLSAKEAENTLLDAWHNQLQIQLIDGDRAWTATPDQLGLKLDVQKTVDQARAVGMAGIPLGYNVEQVVTLDSVKVEIYLNNLEKQVYVPSYNAGFERHDNQLIGVPGRSGHSLNIDGTLALLTKSLSEVVMQRQLNLVTSPLFPDVSDPTPYLETVRSLTSLPFALTGYDPFRDESITWTTTREASTSWLEVNKQGLDLREAAFIPFLEAQNTNLHVAEVDRYLDPTETVAAMRRAIAHRENTVALRIRYHPATYTVMAGDTGYRIARKTGIPFYLIQAANAGFDLSVLSPGDTVKLPSRDVTVPLVPVNNKRIIVNLNTQYLYAYENGKQKFSWSISSGIEQAPTSPGIFQILSHEPVAYGSSYTLCSDTGCGQWEMKWFMGIYEVTPGLVNGFHGAVLLPNGAYLGGGNVGKPYTLGCIMSQNDDAQKLYEWADEGTIVEIVSSEYPPQSDIARLQAG